MVKFTKAGRLHVLAGIWGAGSQSGNVTYPSKAAREAVASRATAGETPSGSALDQQ